MSERQTKAGNQECFGKLWKLAKLANLQTCKLANWSLGHAEQLLSSCVCSKFTLSHSRTLTLSHSLIISFNHSRHAEQVLFWSLCSEVTVYSRKLQCFFLDTSHSHTLSCYFRSHRAGSQLKTPGFLVHPLVTILWTKMDIIPAIRILIHIYRYISNV